MTALMSSLPPQPVVLDAGCGPGHLARFLEARGAFAVGLDYSDPMLREGKRRRPEARLLQGDLVALPFRDRCFHGVWARASLIHLDDLAHRQALREFFRTLKTGGILYAAVRQGRGSELRSDRFHGVTVDRFFRFWEKDEWTASLEESGFAILESGLEAGEPEDWLWAYARKRSDIL
jgi:ubiquinone/menaquinone biosynthesis C-methylase UbiE